MLDTVFSSASALALIGWAGLVLLPRNDFVVKVLARMIIPGAIGLAYTVMFALNFDAMPADGGFGSVAEVKGLFQVDEMILIGWIHYLAFDLFVGSWEVDDAGREGLPHLLVVPCLLLTLLAGPAGLLLYLALRTGRRLSRTKVAATAA